MIEKCLEEKKIKTSFLRNKFEIIQLEAKGHILTEQESVELRNLKQLREELRKQLSTFLFAKGNLQRTTLREE